MNIVSPQFIRAYLLEKFNDIGKLSASGREFIMESVFADNDWKRHLSINVDSGLWQCFKTGRSGNFISFYSTTENLPYFRAQKDLIIKNFEYLDLPIPELARPQNNQAEIDTSELEPITLSSGFSEDKNTLDAWNFLFSRNLFNKEEEEADAFYLCRTGKFKNRIIIPFRSDGVVYYFQGRALYDVTPKYLNPSIEVAPKPSDILYPYDEEQDHLVVCEGPLDARSLQLQGVNATCSIGSSVSYRQAEILSTFKGKIILGYDNDEAGNRGIRKFDRTRKELRLGEFEVCPPPPKYKDWNEAHIENFDLYEWLMERSEPYNFEYKAASELRLL